MRNKILLLLPAVLTLTSIAAFGRSRYVDPFEEYRRTGDSDLLAKRFRDFRGLDLRDDVPYLAEVLSDDLTASYLFAVVRSELLVIALGTLGTEGWQSTEVRELFRPVQVALGHRLSLATDPKEVRDWSFSLASLTAYVGLQPTAGFIPSLFTMAESNDGGAQRIALQALARLKPLTPEAKKLVLQHAEDFTMGMGLLVLALHDSDIAREFLRQLEDGPVEKQRAAARALADLAQATDLSGVMDSVLRLQVTPGVDARVNESLRKAISVT